MTEQTQVIVGECNDYEDTEVWILAAVQAPIDAAKWVERANAIIGTGFKAMQENIRLAHQRSKVYEFAFDGKDHLESKSFVHSSRIETLRMIAARIGDSKIASSVVCHHCGIPRYYVVTPKRRLPIIMERIEGRKC